MTESDCDLDQQRHGPGASERRRESALAINSPEVARVKSDAGGGIRRLIAQVLRFAGAGLVTFPIGLGVTALCHEILGMPEEIAAAIALAVLLVVGFILSRRFVFSSTGKLFGQAWRFLLIAVAARATEYVVFLGFFLLLGVNYLYALIVTLGISFGFKFLFYRNWIFNDRD